MRRMANKINDKKIHTGILHEVDTFIYACNKIVNQISFFHLESNYSTSSQKCLGWYIGTLFYANGGRVDFAADKVERDWSLARWWNVLCPGVEGETRGGFTAIRIPRGSKTAPCMLPTSPRLASNNYRAILFILMPRIAGVSSFRFFHQRYVTAVRPFSFPATDPVRLHAIRSGSVRSDPRALAATIESVLRHGGRFFCASFAQNLVSIPSRKRGEGRQLSSGEPRRRLNAIPYDGSYSAPFLPLPLDDAERRFHIGVKEHRPLRKSHYRRVRLRLSSPPFPLPPIFFLSFLLSPSTGAFLLLTGISSFFSHGSYSTGTSWDPRREIQGPGDRRVVTVIPQKDSDARLLSLTRFAFLFSSLSLSLLPSFRLRPHCIDTVSLRPRVSDRRVDFHEQIDRDETGTVSGVTIKRASKMRTRTLEKSSLSWTFSRVTIKIELAIS